MQETRASAQNGSATHDEAREQPLGEVSRRMADDYEERQLDGLVTRRNRNRTLRPWGTLGASTRR